MTIYSFLFIDENDLIGESKRIECFSDEQAIDLAAQEPGDYKAIQIWDGDRPIRLIGNPRNPAGA